MTTSDAGREGRALVVIAHPDDEVIFFWQAIRRLLADGLEVHVLCATGQFGAMDYTHVRRREFHHACRLLRAKPFFLDLTDGPARLDGAALRERLSGWARANRYTHVYTHGVWGEYGHRHHRDVSWAVHDVFDPVTSLAGPFAPVETHRLRADELESKRAMARAVYRSQPVAVQWCTEVEQFTVLRRNEATLFRLLSCDDVDPAVGFLCAQPSGCRDHLIRMVRACASAFGRIGPPSAELTRIERSLWAASYKGWLDTLERFLSFVREPLDGQSTDFW